MVADPSLGPLAAAWIRRHCVIPDGRLRGRPFTMYQWQALCTWNHYRVRPEAEVGQLATAFANRRSLVVGPQKIGKGPWSATIVANEGRGPALFAGWAGPDDGYACSDHGCGCGWEFAYAKLVPLMGDRVPMGEPWATPLIQLTATAEDQVANVYRPLQAMIRGGRLGDLVSVGESFIRLGNDGRIDVVTSSAQSKLGAPVTFVLQDETGIWTKTNKLVDVAKTQRRGAAGMGGRVMETTNAPDPSVESVALATMRAAVKTGDIYVYHREPPKELGEYKVKANRRKIHGYAYADCAHVDLDGIDSEADEMVLEDPRNAERFFGNRMVAGSSKWTTPEEWRQFAIEPEEVRKGEPIVLGFDGSDGTTQGHHRMADSTVLRACRVSDGYRWTIKAWEHPTDPEGNPERVWHVPRTEVMETIRATFKRYKVVLAGFDPPWWRSEIAELIEDYGDDVVLEFRTANEQLMAAALNRLKLATTPHDGCEIVARHACNAVTQIKEYRDDNDQRKRLVLVTKPSKDSPDKIDGLISDAIANDMRDRAIAKGVRRKRSRAVGF